MPVPTQLHITELDYDQVLTNLVEFMKNDPAFADYDFAGSGLRLLARVLAYVTFYQNYYLSAAVNESFLDTAQLRSSVASHARMLGYNIHGTQSAQFFANVAVELSNTAPASVTLPQRTEFLLAANTQFVFYNVDDTVLVKNANTALYEAQGVELVEGRPLTYRFTVNLNDPTQRFVIPNANIDYTTMSVRVEASASSNVATTFQQADSLLSIGPTDPVFFVQESYSGFPEVKFGNGVIGKPLEHGNIVVVDYFVSRGAEGNNLRGPFTITSAGIPNFLRGATAVDGNTTPSMGGADTESLDSARFLAPLTYSAQNRCVTVDDYKNIILSHYGEHIAAVNVFGGEQGDPNDPDNRPIYGRVFVAVKPKIGLRFTDIVRRAIENDILIPRSVVGVIPEVIDPDYTYLNVSTSVKYDAKASTRTVLQLQQAIANNIVAFTEANVEKFDTAFRFSKFTRTIDDTDESIVSSLTRVDLEKRIYPSLKASNQFVLKFNAPIRRNGDASVVLEATSHRFNYKDASGIEQTNCFFYEKANNLHVAYRDGNNQIMLAATNIGSVNPSSGLITITNFIPESIEGDQIDVRVRVIPAVNDFVPRLNQLFTIDPAQVFVQVLNDITATTADQTNFFAGGVLP